MAKLMTLEKKNTSGIAYKLKHFDYIMLALVVALSTIGIVAVTSADETLRGKQITGVVVCTVIMIGVSLVNYKFLLKFWWAYYLINLALLILVLVRGSSSHGASRWLYFGSYSFQPSEVAKILLILFYAQFIMKYREKIGPYIFTPLCFVLLLPPLILVFRQPDLSTSIMLLIIFAAIMFAGGVDRRVVYATLIVLIPLVIFMVYTAAAWDTHPILDIYQQRRIKAWLHPEDYTTEEALQTLNSLMAIGSGQMRGKGINTGEITSVLNGGFISESETDLIFTVIGEEMGFIGGVAVVLLVLFISLKCLLTAARTRDRAARIIAASVGAWIGFQAFMNIGVATGVIPNTGIPLPFVSSGISSLLATYGAVGVVINIGMHGKRRFP